MEKYEVIGLLGEGSFGRVYKAREISQSKFVAFKVISKRGRSTKELKGLRRECEIQRDLHHPNIIQMLDSFETDNEIVVITEFAHKELFVILGKEGYLSEERVQTIVWDLVSALYYLHSHRVLHRDLKPQNILLDANNTAKLCDFGFARNMSTGTHVLTSIKGTPLYMAPELIEEQPYDHNADLWSLGCIIYELLVGAPPFCTASILHLIRLIRHEQIQWPTFLSEHCISFLRGLLQKNPSKRLTWPEILEHPFVKGHILIEDDSTAMALTRPLSANTQKAKQLQKETHVTQKKNAVTKIVSSKSADDVKSTKRANMKASKSNEAVKSETLPSGRGDATILEDNANGNDFKIVDDLEQLSIKSSTSSAEENKMMVYSNFSYNFHEDSHPIESGEWTEFLQRTTKEILKGEVPSLTQPNFANMIISPLRNSNVSADIIKDVVVLLSSPFMTELSEEILNDIKKVYIDVKVVPNILYSCKLLMRHKEAESTDSTSSNPTPSPRYKKYKSIDNLSEEELQAIETTFLMICRLVYTDVQFLSQFCDSVVVFKINPLLQQFLNLSKLKPKIVSDLLAILILILKSMPENCKLVHKITIDSSTNKEVVSFVGLLKHSYNVLRERMCYFLLYLSYNSLETLEAIWSAEIRETLEDLVYDSFECIRNVAEQVVEEMKTLEFTNV